MMSRLEEIKARQKDAAYLLGGTMIRADWDWLIEQAEERNEWKGKHSILKRKYKSLQRKMNNNWRANRAIMNESKQKHNVLEAFREENQRYKQALEQVWEMTKESIMDGRIYIVVDKALKGESE